MAQVKKIEVETRIIKEARLEFLKNGFQKANLRDIAEAAEVSLANLYSYFDSKDALFGTVVHHAKADLDHLTALYSQYRPECPNLDSLETEIERSQVASHYIYKNRVELDLLFNGAAGSSLENYAEELVNGYVNNCKNFTAYLQQEKCLINYAPSDFFFASVGRMFVAAMKEVLREKASEAEIQKRAEELTRYNFAGFRGMAFASSEKHSGLAPYLIMHNAQKAIEFYKRAFGAVETRRMQGPDGKIMHADISIGKAHIMLADEYPDMGFKSPRTIGGSPASLHLYVENADASCERAVSAGAKLLQPVADQFFGDRHGLVQDPFGYTWTLATHVKDVSNEELEMLIKAYSGV